MDAFVDICCCCEWIKLDYQQVHIILVVIILVVIIMMTQIQNLLDLPNVQLLAMLPPPHQFHF